MPKIRSVGEYRPGQSLIYWDHMYGWEERSHLLWCWHWGEK
jgi:hypothetical protein